MVIRRSLLNIPTYFFQMIRNTWVIWNRLSVKIGKGSVDELKLSSNGVKLSPYRVLTNGYIWRILRALPRCLKHY